MAVRRWFILLTAALWLTIAACDDLNPADDPVSRTDPTAQTITPAPKMSPGHLSLRVERQQIEVCRRPYGLAVSADDETAFVACPGSNQLAAIDTSLLEVRWVSEPTNERLFRVIADPRRDRVYAVAMSGRFLHIYNGATGKRIKRLRVGQNIADFALVPGKDRMVVTATDPPTAWLIDLQKMEVDGQVEFPTPPGSLAMRADGLLAAASSGLWRETASGPKPVYEPIYLFDPSVPGKTEDRLGFGGTQARGGVFVRGGTTLLVPGRQSATVSVFEVDERRLVRSIQVGAGPEKIVVSTDQRWAYTLDTHGASVTRLDLNRREAAGHVALPGEPQDLAVAPDGAELYLTLPARSGRAGKLAVVDNSDLMVADLIPVGHDPCCLTFLHNGRRLLVSNHQSNSVSVIE